MTAPIFDSHCHAWERWPYQPAVPDKHERGTTAQLIFEMVTNGVSEALVVCAAIDENADNLEYVADACKRYPDRLHMVADLDCVWSDTYHTPGSVKRLAALADRYALVGVAHYLDDRNDGWLLSEDAEAVFALASELGLIISLGADPGWLLRSEHGRVAPSRRSGSVQQSRRHLGHSGGRARNR